jgi:predicted transcriptional regulator
VINLPEILDILDARILTGQVALQKTIESVYCADLMSDVLSFSVTKSLLLTGLTNTQVVRTAEMAAIEVIVFIQGKQPDVQTIRLAEEKDILLVVTDFSMFETCGRLYEKGLRSRCHVLHHTPLAAWRTESA